jgi:hypothetical protein
MTIEPLLGFPFLGAFPALRAGNRAFRLYLFAFGKKDTASIPCAVWFRGGERQLQNAPGGFSCFFRNNSLLFYIYML